MNVDDIPSGNHCVLDTDILIYAEAAASLQTQRLLWLVLIPTGWIRFADTRSTYEFLSLTLHRLWP